ncbi:MAG TPA: hypothetical protein VGK73_26705 [Polyangiaceae bacterium]
MRNWKRSLALFGLGTLALGCGGDEALELDDPENVKVWATTASALGVYMNVYQPVAVAGGHDSFVDPACPETTDDGTTLGIEGGCTDAEGMRWIGRATIERSGGDLNLTFEDFGSFPQADDPNSRRGRAEIREIESDVHEFDIVLSHAGGVTTAFDYRGRVEGTYDTRTVWSGSGRVERRGSVPPLGAVSATTVAQVVDDEACSGQPASGTTTLKAGDETAGVTYDGATDCDAEARAHWSLDGEDRGTIDGIVCSVALPGAGTRGSAAALAILGVLALAFGGRRRASVTRRHL